MNDERKTMMEDAVHGRSGDALARAVHWSLLIGLLVSAFLMVSGLLIVMLGYQPRPESLITNVRELVRMAAECSGVAWMELGVLMLMFTPIVRVVVLAIGWTARRELRMAAVAVVVLVLLTISICLSAG